MADPTSAKIDTKNEHYTFELAEGVTRTKVTFRNHFGIELAGDLYTPKSAAKNGNAALAISGPFGAVKEQSSGFYANQMASRGYIALAFDPSYTGESGGEPRYMNSPDINTEDFMAAVDYLSTRSNIDPEKIGIVPNGVHMERFEHIPEVQQHEGPFTVGAVVRVVPIKDIVTLLRAFFLVQQELPDAELYVMGGLEEDPDYYALCQQTVEMLQIRNVHFTGSVNVVEYLPKMDVMVLSSISEGQPLAVLEGQAAHRPFVTTDVGCCRELIYGPSDDHLGAAGSIVAPMDFEAMSGEILRLARDFELRRKMGNIGYERAKRGYTYEFFIESYRKIYEQEKEVRR